MLKPHEGNEQLAFTDNTTKPEFTLQWGDHVRVRNTEDGEWENAVFLHKDKYYCVMVGKIDYPLHFRYCEPYNW